MDTATFANPSNYAGIWFVLHTRAALATTEDRKREFVREVNDICENLRCKNSCQPHFRKFIDTHPFENYWNIRDPQGRDIGFFKWTWECHNEVNRFLRKYQPSLEEAYAYYSNSEAGACFSCNDEGKQRVPIIKVVARKATTSTNNFQLVPRV